jgi:hypothetical protein
MSLQKIQKSKVLPRQGFVAVPPGDCHTNHLCWKHTNKQAFYASTYPTNSGERRGVFPASSSCLAGSVVSQSGSPPLPLRPLKFKMFLSCLCRAEMAQVSSTQGVEEWKRIGHEQNLKLCSKHDFAYNPKDASIQRSKPSKVTCMTTSHSHPSCVVLSSAIFYHLLSLPSLLTSHVATGLPGGRVLDRS